MEKIATEVVAIAHELTINGENEIMELDAAQLACVGGGCGEVTLS